MRFPRLGVRTRLLIAIVGAVAIALTIGVAALNVLLGQRLAASATALAKAQAETELSSLRVEGGTLISPEAPDAGALTHQVWVFARSEVLEAPRAPVELDRTARSLAGSPERSLDIGEEARLYAIPVIENGVRYGTVVAAVSLDPYEETGRAALIGSLILAAVLLVAVTLVSWWMLGRALLPVSRMTESATTWSEHDLDERFNLGEPYDELTRLAATLDGLLERIAGSLRREQRFTAEISHELRTPLARAKGQTDLMLRRERTPEEYRIALESINRNIDEMTRTVEALVAASRHEAGLTQATSDLRDVVGGAVEAVRAADPARAVRLSVPRDPVRVSAEGELMTRIIQPLIDNACRYGRSALDIRVTRAGPVATVEIDDDGPGVSEEERDLIFDPGVQGSAASNGSAGAGLGLALARRLARSVGGEITVHPSRSGGRFSLRVPLRP